MKKKNLKKLLLAVCCAALLVCVSIGATVAYLTSKDTVENTFTVGKVKITLDEADVDENGTPIKDADRVAKNEYKLMPSHTYTKDPTVHVEKGSENSWIFVKVENDIANYEADNDAETVVNGYKKIEDQIIKDNGWTQLTDVEGKAVAGVYYKEYTQNNEKDTDMVVFSNFKIADEANKTTGWSNLNTAKVTVTAYAIQADGFDEAIDAWSTVQTAA